MNVTATVATVVVVASSSSTTASVPLFRLNNLHDNAGAVTRRTRVGRGPGSGLGKTCGKGQKGQNTRTGGGVRPGFEGGQTPLYKAKRKFGFSNKQFAVEYEPVNLGKVQFWIDSRRIDPALPITMRVLVESGLVKRNAAMPHGIKLLAKGADVISQPLTFEVADASAAAIAVVERAGGQVFKVFYNKLGLRVHLGLYRHTDRPLPRFCTVPPHEVARGKVHPTEVPSSALPQQLLSQQ